MRYLFILLLVFVTACERDVPTEGIVEAHLRCLRLYALAPTHADTLIVDAMSSGLWIQVTGKYGVKSVFSSTDLFCGTLVRDKSSASRRLERLDYTDSLLDNTERN